MDYPSDPNVLLDGGKFTDGDPLTATPASLDPASHMNAITDELLEVISDAGLVPDETTLTQLRAAIDAKILAALGGMSRRLVELGDWNMDTTGTLSIAHGLDITKVRSVSGVLRNDDGTLLLPLGLGNLAGPAWVENLNATHLTLMRAAGGVCDSANYDSTGYNRGWVIWDLIP